ncbi:MAG: hypothetical protein ACO3S0_17065 [bacterium]|jgi:hypothetical protein
MTETRKESSISLGDMKSIFITQSFDNKTVVALYVPGGYIYINLDNGQLDQLIDALTQFKKETV